MTTSGWPEVHLNTVFPPTARRIVLNVDMVTTWPWFIKGRRRISLWRRWQVPERKASCLCLVSYEIKTRETLPVLLVLDKIEGKFSWGSISTGTLERTEKETMDSDEGTDFPFLLDILVTWANQALCFLQSSGQRRIDTEPLTTGLTQFHVRRWYCASIIGCVYFSSLWQFRVCRKVLLI